MTEVLLKWARSDCRELQLRVHALERRVAAQSSIINAGLLALVALSLIDLLKGVL
jgi:hypothetical protein